MSLFHCVVVAISCDGLQNLLELETDGGSPNKSLEDFSYVPLGSEGCNVTHYSKLSVCEMLTVFTCQISLIKVV